MNKIVYCIRHGTALHNVLFWKIGTKAYTDYRDTKLTVDGINPSCLANKAVCLAIIKLLIISINSKVHEVFIYS